MKKNRFLCGRPPRVNDLAMGQLKDLIREGMTEEQVAAGLLDIYKSLGAQSYSFRHWLALVPMLHLATTSRGLLS